MTLFTHREEPLYPTLRLFQNYLLILPYQQVDKGAIKFALNVASIMYPGLTSGAKFYPGAVDTMVAIMTLEKQLANLCVGVMEMSIEDIEGVNRGIGIKNIHFLCLLILCGLHIIHPDLIHFPVPLFPLPFTHPTNKIKFKRKHVIWEAVVCVTQ
ncbi:Malignant T-cell-amplified sequence 1 [Lemmus lemmus]